MNIGDEFKDEAGNTLRVVKLAAPKFKLGDKIRRSDYRAVVIARPDGKYGILYTNEGILFYAVSGSIKYDNLRLLSRYLNNNGWEFDNEDR